MSQFEYNDLNKFFVSVGIFLIGLTFLLPWLFLKENFDLLVKVEDLNKLTSSAKSIIEQRQSLIGTYSLVIPIVSIISFLIGAFLIFKGTRGWRKLQIILEEREELTNKKLSLEIVKLSEEEKFEKVSKDIEIAQITNSSTDIKKTKEARLSLAQQYLKVEKTFGNLVRKAIDDRFKVFQDFRIEENEFDLLLKSPMLSEKDILFEVKYSASRIGGQYFHQSLQQLKKSLGYYRQKMKSKADGRLVFIMPSKGLTEKSMQPESLYENTLSLIENSNRENRREGIYICHLDYDKLETYTSDEIISILKL
jgi:hypothetical protein